MWQADSDDFKMRHAGGAPGAGMIYVTVSEAAIQGKNADNLSQSTEIKLSKSGDLKKKTPKNSGALPQPLTGSGGVGDGLGKGIGSGIDVDGPSVATHLLTQIRKKIFSKKYFPEVAKENNWTGEVEVLFQIREDGNIAFVKISKSSGFRSLDEASIQAVKKSAPLPYYPKQIALVMEYQIAN